MGFSASASARRSVSMIVGFTLKSALLGLILLCICAIPFMSAAASDAELNALGERLLARMKAVPAATWLAALEEGHADAEFRRIATDGGVDRLNTREVEQLRVSDRASLRTICARNEDMRHTMLGVMMGPRDNDESGTRVWRFDRDNAEATLRLYVCIDAKALETGHMRWSGVAVAVPTVFVLLLFRARRRRLQSTATPPA